jgi:hypothetical protein
MVSNILFMLLTEKFKGQTTSNNKDVINKGVHLQSAATEKDVTNISVSNDNSTKQITSSLL